MTRHTLGAMIAASFLLTAAGTAAAQNTAEPVTTPPATGTERPSTTASPPVTTTEPSTRTDDPAPRTSPEVVTVPVVVPQQTPAPAPIELPDTAYPNGFADPNAAFGNDLSVQVREEGDGFDWGLLGLLGLVGLLGLRRPREGHRHVVHSERYDDGRPPRV